MKRILVTGATGRAGRQVVLQLASMGAELRALVREPDKAGLPPGVAVMRGDLTAADSLEEGLAGVDAVFLVWTAPAEAIPAALERIVKAAPRVVFLSSPYKTPHPFFQAGQPNAISPMHAEIERRLEGSGREWTFLRPGMFSENARMWWAEGIKSGGDVVRWPFAEAPTAPIDERDIAAVAVRALIDEGHAGAEYVLTGPESLTQSKQLAIIGEVIGRRLRMEDISPDEARGEILTQFPAPLVNMLLRAWGGAMGQPALVTNTVAEVTGIPARSFRTWATENAKEFRV